MDQQFAIAVSLILKPAMKKVKVNDVSLVHSGSDSHLICSGVIQE